ncbi:TPA: PAAR domain-containing protein [Vibrio parahaemolyticus]|nr:PAAR domain-containing protein [Vibrio parahaemolyticus]HBC3831659.1 PAAR domain-containing protein [Vibrio parahaemolyticus]
MSKYKVITLGTPTSTGGKVVSASSDMIINGQKVVLIDDLATCNCGDKKCNKQGRIVKGTPRDFKINGIEPAIEGDRVLTTCGKCFLLSSGHNVDLGEIMGQSITIGGNGKGVFLGDGVSFNLVAHTPYAQSQNVSSPSLANSLGTVRERATASTNEVNRYQAMADIVGGQYVRTAAQQAYSFTEEEWENDLQSDLKTYLENNQHIVVIYSLDDAVSILKALAEKYGKTVKEIGAIAAALYKVGKSTYDAAKIAKSFGDFGMKVKPFLDKNGNERISISTKNQSVKHVMSNGVRVKLNSSKSYSVANAKVIQSGVSPKARTGRYKGSVLITFVISASINTKDLILDDDFLLDDWLGNVGLDLFKAGISIGAGEFAILLLPTLPFIAEAFVCAAVASSLAYAYDYFEVDDLILKVLSNE